jgi:hypothetical protein
MFCNISIKFPYNQEKYRNIMAKLTTEDFIRKAREVHGDKYDYSKVEYITAKAKVIIICSKHGEFLQKPYHHYHSKSSCPKCVGRNKSTNDIIDKFIAIHGNKYDYSKTIYVNVKTKMTIICPKHGEFLQNAPNHLLGKGCHKCAGRGLTKEDFIKEARVIHGDKYDYSKVIYNKSIDDVIIICPEHGEFLTQPTVHINNKRGCSKCAGHYMDTEYFKEKAKTIHGNKYDYSKVVYEHNAKKVIIICPEHGEFAQAPNSHLSNATGCPECGKMLISESRRMTQEEYIKKAKEVHKNKFDYSKVVYVNMHEKIIIICPIHGEFKQEASAHLYGKQGCPKCGGRYMDSDYFIEKANEKHNNKYDYSKVEYVNAKSKVIIICPEHDEFEQTPNGHLNGRGCSVCAGKEILNLMSYEKLKELVRSLGIKCGRQYTEWWQKNEEYCKKNGIPSKPDRQYR